MTKLFNWLGEFLTDSATGKASGTALMKLGSMIVFWWAFIRVCYFNKIIPNIPTELVIIVLAILFEKKAGQLIDAYINVRTNGISPNKIQENQ